MRGNSVPVATQRFRLAAALVWFVAFCVWFHSFGLPNNQPLFDFYIYGDASQHPAAQRWMAWKILPFDLLDLLDPPVEQNAAPWTWLYLSQRLPFVGVAAFVWLSSVCLGRLALRGLRLSPILDRAERLFFAGCLGLAIVSLLMLGLGLMGAMNRWSLMLALTVATTIEIWLTRCDCRHLQSRDFSSLDARRSAHRDDVSVSSEWLSWIVLIVAVPFVSCLLLGAMSPQTDFDVIEYHLGGPKEWFQQGRISRLPHNVYTSFPFLTEMLLLSGMVVCGDWDWGALAGQEILAGFVPLTAIGLFATGRRWFSPIAGWLAALIWLTTPWVYRISIIAYAEGGLACYLFAAFALALRIAWSRGECGNQQTDAAQPAEGSNENNSLSLVLPFACGLLSGCAMSCKYTGLVSVVVPVGLLIAWSVWRSSTTTDRMKYMIVTSFVFGAGVLVSVGSWLLKNSIETGNPVFPLAYSVFGGDERDAVMDAQWRHGHSRHYPNLIDMLADVPVKLTDVAANNDWHSALMFGLAPIALLASWRKKIWVVWTFIGWQFFSWFLFTHQIDRFYVPMFSVVALLAGCGASWLVTSGRIGAWVGTILIASNVVFNAWMMEQQRMTGFNAGRMDLHTARDLIVSPSIDWLNREYASGRLPRETKVLCVGEAALFHAKFPYVYNTVFDRSLFEQWFGERTESGLFRLRPTDQIRATLREHRITHVLVNWTEILRYREPGSYGYTDFAHPGRFQELQAAGILGSPLPLPDQASFVPVDETKREQIRNWAPRLGISLADRPGCRSVQVFPVRL